MYVKCHTNDFMACMFVIHAGSKRSEGQKNPPIHFCYIMITFSYFSDELLPWTVTRFTFLLLRASETPGV